MCRVVTAVAFSPLLLIVSEMLSALLRSVAATASATRAKTVSLSLTSLMVWAIRSARSGSMSTAAPATPARAVACQSSLVINRAARSASTKSQALRSGSPADVMRAMWAKAIALT